MSGSTPQQTPEEILEQAVNEVLTANQPEPPQAEPDKSHKKSAPSTRRSKPVFIYLAVMFAAAFLLLLMAYFIQERNHALDLQNYMERSQTMEELRIANQALQEQLAALQRAQNDLKADYEANQSALTQMEQAYQETLEWFWITTAVWNAERLFNDGDYENCAQVLTELTGSSAIPDFEIDNEGRLSLVGTITHLWDQLRELGYLDDEIQIKSYNVSLGIAIPD